MARSLRIGVLESEQTDNEDAMSNDDVFMAKRVNCCVAVTCGARGQTVGATGAVSFRTPKYSTIHAIVDLMKRSVAMPCTIFNTQMKLCETSIYADRKHQNTMLIITRKEHIG